MSYFDDFRFPTYIVSPTRWLEVQTFEVGEEGSGRTKPLLIRPEAVVSVDELQLSDDLRLWRFVNMSDGDCVSVVWTEKVAKRLGVEEGSVPRLRARLEREAEKESVLHKAPDPVTGGLAFGQFLRLAERFLPKPGSSWVWQPDKPHATIEVDVEEVRWNGEEFWVATTGRRGGVAETHHNELDHFLESARPCPPPASPPSAEPAGETSGGERCGRGTVCPACGRENDVD